MEPQIRFCTSADGTRIAYATMGEGPPLVVSAGWADNLELEWQDPLGRAFLEGLGLRDYALCSLFLDCGLRASEACRLSVSDLHDGMVLVRHSQSGRVRSVPLGQKAQRAIYSYLATGRPRLKPGCESLLMTREGLPLSRNTVRQVLDRLSQKVGFKLSAHRFRHTSPR